MNASEQFGRTQWNNKTIAGAMKQKRNIIRPAVFFEMNVSAL
jgi:hypothetical protein